MITDHSFLHTKYPNIFTPYSNAADTCFPTVWLNIVDHMCSSINVYINSTNILAVKPHLKYRYKFYIKYWPQLKKAVFKILNPERNYYIRYNNKLCINPIFDTHRISNTICYRLLNRFNKLAFKFFNGYSFYEDSTKRLEFKIVEITNLDDNLVVNYKGGDNFIRGIISLAQHMVKSTTLAKEIDKS
jgi:hypothetical protein